MRWVEHSQIYFWKFLANKIPFFLRIQNLSTHRRTWYSVSGHSTPLGDRKGRFFLSFYPAPYSLFLPPFALEVLSTSSMLLSFYPVPILYPWPKQAIRANNQELSTGRILIFQEVGICQEEPSFHFCSHRNRSFEYLKLELSVCCPPKTVF